MIERACQHCAATFLDDPDRRGPRRKYCSRNCCLVANSIRLPLPERPCAKCGTVFVGRNNSLFCTALCKRRATNYRPVTGGNRLKGIREHKDDLIAMYEAGSTLEQIGQKYGVSRERVRQIISQYGIKREDGGLHKRAVARATARQARADARYMRRFGMTRAEYIAINHPRKRSAGWRAPIRYYQDQKKNSATRSIPFLLTFAQWWQIWQDSGKWSIRGRYADSACMSRNGDKGAYEIGNVYISTIRQNSSEGRIDAVEHPRERSAAHAIVTAAGGPTAVGAAAGVKPNYVSILAVNGHLPKSWITDGRIQKIAELTAGAYSAEQIIQLAVAA